MPCLACLTGACCFLMPHAALAYIDPGSGAYYLQMLMALVGAGAFYITHPRKLMTLLAARWRTRRARRHPPAQ